MTIQKQGETSSTVSANWTQDGQLVFAPAADTTPGVNYTISFVLQNKNCQQDAPATTMEISGLPTLCFPIKTVDPLLANHCNVKTAPLQVLGGPCNGMSSSAIFTLKNISQSTPFPGCNNTITVELMTSIPLSHHDLAAVQIKFDSTLTIGLRSGDIKLDGTSKDRFFGNSAADTAKAQWNADTNQLTLKIAPGQDLDACQTYTVSFVVINPFKLNSAAGPILQEAEVVTIGAVGSLGELIGDSEMMVDETSAMSLPGTTLNDRAPMRVHLPIFFVKNIGQSSPYPGGKNNLTVTISTNFNLQKGAVIYVHEVSEAVAAEGNIRLTGENAVQFESLSGANEHGTWNDCDKVLILKVASDLGCNGDNYTISFEVMNPLQPQVAASILINATKIKNARVFMDSGPDQPSEFSITQDNSQEIGDLSDGQPMVGDMVSVPTGIYGAMSGDAAPMAVWPAAFLVKDIGQSNQYPGGLNTLSITFATNVPIWASVQYPGKTAIKSSIVLSNIFGAVRDDLNADGEAVVQLASSYSSQVTFDADGSRRQYTNDTVLFTDKSGNKNNSLTWKRMPGVQSKQSQVVLYMNPASIECCVPESKELRFVFSFQVC